MAVQRWRGDAPAVAQVATVTITGDDAATTYKITINGKVVSALGSGTGVNNTATALYNALIASTVPPEFKEMTYTVNAAIITMTAVTAGKPFTATSSTTGGAGTIGAVTTTVSSSGPNDVSIAGNWSTGTLPIAGDDIYFDLSNVSALYGLSQFIGVLFNSLNVPSSYTGQIGLTQLNSAGYYEYRPIYFQCSATTTSIGYGPGTGSGLIKIDSQASQTTLLIYNTATGTEGGSGALAISWKGTNANNVVEILKGSLAIAPRPGEVATITTLYVGYVQNIGGDSTVFAGSGVTFTTINQAGGSITLNSGFTTLSKTGGNLTVLGNGVNLGTVTIDAGNFFYQSTGTITQLNVGNAGQALFTQDLRARTISGCNLYKGATLMDPFATVIWNGNPKIQFVRCRYTECTVDLGENRGLNPV